MSEELTVEFWAERQKEVDERNARYKAFQQKWECKNNECERWHCVECGVHIRSYIDMVTGEPCTNDDGMWTDYRGHCFDCWQKKEDDRIEAEVREKCRVSSEILQSQIELDRG